MHPPYLSVICSVTTLGARGRSVGAVAAGVVSYLEGDHTARGASRPRTRTDLPSPDGGVVTYYADTTEGPGTWVGAGAAALGLDGTVEPTELWHILQGQDPGSGAALLGARGSAGRAQQGLGLVDDRPWWSLGEAALVVGVSPAYLRRLAERTQRAAVERAVALPAGAPLERATGPWLRAEKHHAAWRVSGSALAVFVAGRRPPAVVVGYDVTFSVEKSVSALWARSDDRVRGEILAGFDAAVGAGVAYLESHAARVRVDGRRQQAQGLVAASYLHTTSRAFDPQLHRHVVVANVAHGPDGTTRALDATGLFHHATTASHLAAAELRHQLTARLGVTWGEVRNGIAEIAGIPGEALEAVSTRRREIDAAARGLAVETGGTLDVTAPAVRQVLALATRAPKDHRVGLETLREQWCTTLAEAGFTAEIASDVLYRGPGPRLVADGERAELLRRLVGPEGVTARQATFDRRDVLQAVAAWSVDRLSAQACAELADGFLATPEVVALQGRGATGPRYTTTEMLAVEGSIDDHYRRGRGAGRAVVPREIVDQVLARPGFAHLAKDQRALVHHLTAAGSVTGLVKGPAGTGKTTCLEAAARAWEEAGFRVLGVSVNGTAAEHLGRAAGIEAATVASVLWRLERDVPALVDEHTVIVLDEATTLANRDLERLQRHVFERGSALWLVGDPVQHTAVGAGGAFRWLLETYPDDAGSLTVNRRQVGENLAEVRLALAEYREGAVRDAIERLQRDQRVVTAASSDELLDAMVADWYVDRLRASADPSFGSSSMTAARHDERRALVARARALLRADGTLHGPELVAAGTAFQAGDEVMAKVADRRLRPAGGDPTTFVRNGTRGTVVSVGQDYLVVDFEHRGKVTVPRSYVEHEVAPGVRGGLLHSYCLTTYAAQGATYGSARHLGSDRSSRAELYVGLTRGRHDVTLYAVGREEMVGQVADDLPRLVPETDAARAMAASAAASCTEQLAREVDPEAARIQIDAPPDVVRHLGRRPAGDEAARRWDDALRCVVDYRDHFARRSFPGDPTSELVGLRALATDREAWDKVNRAVDRYLAERPIVDLAPVREVSWTLEIDP